MRTGRGAAALVVVAIAVAVACSGGDGGGGGFGALVDYAVGDWSCALAGDGFTLDIDATVEADTATSGTFTFAIQGGAGVPGSSGDWRLDGRRLEMDVADLSSYAANGVALDTDGIDILEDAPGSEVQEVGVDRNGDTVTFSWSDPWSGTPVEMDCTKA